MTATMYPTRTHGPRPIARAGVGTEQRANRANYAARRVVVGLIVAVCVALLVNATASSVGAVLGVGGSPAVASNVAAASVPRMHVAQPGDTLWSIADQFRGDVGHSRYVDALIDSNGGTAIQIGQVVRLP